MALQTSGMISLNEIHIEAGGTTGTFCAINNADIRGLVGAGNGAAMDFADWYGASGAYSETQTVTIGSASTGGYVNSTIYGYSTEFSCGSISDGTFNGISNATIKETYWSNVNTFLFRLVGNRANSGWSQFVVGGQTFTRASATYLYDSTLNHTSWLYSSVTTNPMGTSGSKALVFS